MSVFVKCKIAVILDFVFVENFYVTVFGFRTTTRILNKNISMFGLKYREKYEISTFCPAVDSVKIENIISKFFYRPILIAMVVLPYTP